MKRAFAIGSMVLAGVAWAQAIPVTLEAAVHVKGPWLTAGDVLRSSTALPAGMNDKLQHIRLAALRSCADLLLSQRDVARRIALQLPGVFDLGAALQSPARLHVNVDGQVLEGAQLAAAIERAVPSSCPPALRHGCAIRLTQTPPSVCVASGEVVYRTDVSELDAGAAPLQARVEVWVDDVHSTTLRLPAQPVALLWGMQLKHDVAIGQAIRASDVEAVPVSSTVAVKTWYDARARLVRAASDLSAADILPADVASALAVGLAHDAVVLKVQVGPVQVSRAARLASDVGRDSNAWAYFEEGGLASIRPSGAAAWELIR